MGLAGTARRGATLPIVKSCGHTGAGGTRSCGDHEPVYIGRTEGSLATITLMDASVVIPFYNAAKWLPETLASVINQTLAKDRFEIVLVDNGSIDGGRDLAQRILEASNLRYRVIIEPTRGVAIARNRGVLEAKGEWIQFLDADDLLKPKKLDVQLSLAQSLPKDIGVVYSSWQRLILQKDGWRVDSHIVSPDVATSQLYSLLSANGFIATGSQLIRRSAFLTIGGFREGIGIIEDVDLVLRLAMNGVEFAPCRMGEPLFYYRTHAAGSHSTRDPKAFTDGCVRNAVMAEAWAREHQSLTSEMRRVLVQSYFQAARFYAGISWQDFRNVYARLKSLDPYFVPQSPQALRVISKVFGYPAAERVAVAYRGAKRRLLRQHLH